MMGDDKRSLWKDLSDEEIIQNIGSCLGGLNTGLNECHQRNLRIEISVIHLNKPPNATKTVVLSKAWKDFSLE